MEGYNKNKRFVRKNLVAGATFTAHKMKFSIKDFVSKYGKIRRKLRILLHLLKKSLMENFIFLQSFFFFLFLF